ncbi:MAG: disulfide bond formation protein B [Candidatus Paceibacterota bacterium]|jgi:disulfide bond formation protein DsbB
MNPENIHYLNVFLGSGTILLQIFSVAALLLLFFGPKKNIFLDYLSGHFLVIGFIVVAFSSFFPLVYSEIINFSPCVLCWWQRVFMFPLVFMFGVALWDKDKRVIRYAIPLLCAGFLVSVYQNFFYYFGDSSSLPCDASGVSCYQKLVSEFGGYISIPMMALTAFGALLVLLAVAHFHKKEVVI